ncbi:MAG: class I SAM-dependent methyltransferase, partial [Candidatus Puniceispirillaceae bacterium]
MVDRDTMAAYAANIDKYRNLVTKIGGNSRLDGFLARLSEGAEILDLGCGVGDSAVRMRDAGFAVSCTDASPDMVATANDLHGLDAVQKSFSELQEDAAYDAVWASFSLLHAPRAEMPANLVRIHRAIRPGGLFYMGLKLGAGEARDAAGRFYA